MDSPILNTSPSTSFIPKTRLTTQTYRSRGMGLSVFISLIILLVSVGLFVGFFLYRNSLKSEVESLSASLDRAQKAFEPNLINEANRVSATIETVRKLSTQHRAASKVFKIISDLTLKDVSFSSFNMSLNNDKKISVNMTAEARSYTDVARQAKLFESDKQAISQVSFSNLGLKEAGRVNFNVSIIINPSSIIYQP